MPGLPVMLHVAGKRCLVIGGGAVGARRARSLCEAGASVTVIATALDEALSALPIEMQQRDVVPEDIADCFLVVVATSDQRVNAMVASEARRRLLLVNRADDPTANDIDFMAASRQGPLALAVHTDGISAAAAAAIRTELAAKLDPIWPRVLELAAPYRPRIQAAFCDDHERQARLRRLTDPTAIAILKGSGEAAFLAYCDTIAQP